ncbi:hypothetical protein N4G69_46005 [Streptomyces mirabilis]|uniref:hypothetical protein n=1 Tax=Streptomyces mirabilis TaxID=68239 RepID=UPI0021C24000|nr:hypothetical protein [Streptomyces mirabilis]MCT9112822.1 hypothetical protein [Streptomyces mirabilis]
MAVGMESGGADADGLAVAGVERRSGCRTLARLVEVVLGNISAPAVRPDDPEARRGLFDLLRRAPTDGMTAYTREQLLVASVG